MTDIAKAAGITREALYKALRPGSAPRFDTVNRVGMSEILCVRRFTELAVG
jgi:probable addiction module antidote protein